MLQTPGLRKWLGESSGDEPQESAQLFHPPPISPESIQQNNLQNLTVFTSLIYKKFCFGQGIISFKLCLFQLL